MILAWFRPYSGAVLHALVAREFKRIAACQESWPTSEPGALFVGYTCPDSFPRCERCCAVVGVDSKDRRLERAFAELAEIGAGL